MVFVLCVYPQNMCTTMRFVFCFIGSLRPLRDVTSHTQQMGISVPTDPRYRGTVTGRDVFP